MYIHFVSLISTKYGCGCTIVCALKKHGKCIYTSLPSFQNSMGVVVQLSVLLMASVYTFRFPHFNTVWVWCTVVCALQNHGKCIYTSLPSIQYSMDVVVQLSVLLMASVYTFRFPHFNTVWVWCTIVCALKNHGKCIYTSLPSIQYSMGVVVQLFAFIYLGDGRRGGIDG